MRTEELDRLIREALGEEASRARFDGWRSDVTSEGPRTRRAGPGARRIAVVAIAAAVVAAGIAVPLVLLSQLRRGPSDDRPARPTQGPTDLWGERFRSIAVVRDGEPSTLVAGTHLEVSFDHRRLVTGPNEDPTPDDPHRGIIGWAAGCNQHGAPVEITTERLLVGENGASTLIGCDPPLEAQDAWLGRFFVSDPSWALNGDILTLTSGDTVIELQRRGAPPAETTTYADRDDGISISIPSRWTFHQDPSGLPDPGTRTLFAAGSWSFPRGGDCAPTSALAALPADGVLFWINETDPERSAIDVRRRPDRFDLTEAPLADPGCSPVGFRYQWFAESGRYLQVNVAYGEDAPDAVRAETLRALDSMALTAPVPDDCPEDVGPWADPDCPDQAWVREIVEDAGYEVTGDTGSALRARAFGVEFFISATDPVPEPPGEFVPLEQEIEQGIYSLVKRIDRIEVYGDGTRTVWTVQRHNIYMTENVDGPPSADVIAALVRASARVDYDAIDTR